MSEGKATFQSIVRILSYATEKKSRSVSSSAAEARLKSHCSRRFLCYVRDYNLARLHIRW